MRQFWICVLCLVGITALGLPLQAQSPNSLPAPAVAAAATAAPVDANFLSSLGTAPAPAVAG